MKVKNSKTRKATKGSRITRVTAEGARKLPDLTDWDRVRNMTEKEIEANAKSDPDNPPWTKEMLAQARMVEPRKQLVSIRLDSDVINSLKREGPGYQSRINAILRAYVSALHAK